MTAPEGPRPEGPRPEGPRRRAARMRETLLHWMFPLGGTVFLLIAFLVALFAR